MSITLEKAGIAAVSIYSDNAYESANLDFVTSEGKKALQSALRELGFSQSGGSRMFEHPHTEWYIEFPPGPLGFGDTFIDLKDVPLLTTQFGQLRIITPTLSVMDRLAAFWYHFDRQCWDQAIEVAKRHPIDWEYVRMWARKEKQDQADIEKLREQSSTSP